MLQYTKHHDPNRPLLSSLAYSLNCRVGDYQYPEINPFDPAGLIQAQPLQHQPLQPSYPSPVFEGSSATPFTTIPHLSNPSKRRFSTTSATPTTPANSSSPNGNNLESSSRHAAEEDKRRRNTAASARFRVKKKQREQALERATKEMTDRAEGLEARIGQLEMENKWLRNLVMEKNAAGKDDVAELWRKFSTENESSRSTDTAKKGVGTETETEVEAEASKVDIEGDKVE